VIVSQAREPYGCTGQSLNKTSEQAGWFSRFFSTPLS
jgi:hypothetical protein